MKVALRMHTIEHPLVTRVLCLLLVLVLSEKVLTCVDRSEEGLLVLAAAHMLLLADVAV